ncbi:MAG: DUF3488 domain-containing transglutaminase family protein [Proteobacteria bacterium]|nr:DUF3488 domain-containing transglutaminase family protein [Pseudomonadota bacterium]
MAESIALPLDARSKAWSLTAALACALPLLRLLPAWLAASLLALGVLGSAAAWKRPLPLVIRLPLTGVFGLLVLSAYGFVIGRDSASALMLAMLLLKPVELTSLRDARSLVGFALFAAFAALLLDQGLLSLGLAMAGTALVFVACARMADAEIGNVRMPLDRRRLRTLAGLFVLAVPLALAGFWFFPRLGSPLWGLPDVAKAKTGIADAMAPGDWLDVLTDDTPAFRVRFDGPTPPQNALYWRGIVLWDFDGRAWRQARWTQALPPAPMQSTQAPIHYRVSLEPTDKRYLFALDLARSTPDGASMAEDRTLSFDQPVGSLRAYAISSAQPSGFETELDPYVRAAALQLPAGFDPRARALAARWRSQTGDDAQIVDAALAMFHRDFSYSLAAPPLGRDSVDEFLFDTKVGFCEHFSSSFTFLMRAAGIPARVVNGYVGGYHNRIGDFLLVRQADAHAWSEVWLQGRGWVRVDPTAAVAPDRVFGRDVARETAGGGEAGNAIGRLFDMGDWLRYGWNQFVLGFDAARQLSLAHALGLEDADSRTLAMLFGALATALLLIVGLWQLREHRAPADPLLRAWERFVRRLQRAGLGKRSHEPAIAWARRIARIQPGRLDAVVALSERFASARYAPAIGDPASRRALIRDLLAFRVDRPGRP